MRADQNKTVQLTLEVFNVPAAGIRMRMEPATVSYLTCKHLLSLLSTKSESTVPCAMSSSRDHYCSGSIVTQSALSDPNL